MRWNRSANRRRINGVDHRRTHPCVGREHCEFAYKLRSEKAKAHREVISKSFEKAREYVTAAVEAAHLYYPIKGSERKPSDLLRLQSAEKRARVILGNLIDWCPKLIPPVPQVRLMNLSDDFIGELTSGSFGEVDGEPDLEQGEKIADLGAKLDIHILSLQQEQMFDWLSRDALQRFYVYMTTPMGISPQIRKAIDGAV